MQHQEHIWPIRGALYQFIHQIQRLLIVAQAIAALERMQVQDHGLWIHGRYDTTGAERSVLSIVQALRWRQAAPTLAVLGDVGTEQTEAAYELGATLAAVLSAG